MKIWLNDLKVGDSFWYHNFFKDVKYGTIVERISDTNYLMERWRLDTGDEMFVNQYGYTTYIEAFKALFSNITKEITNKSLQISILMSDIENLIKLCEPLIDSLKSSPNGDA